MPKVLLHFLHAPRITKFIDIAQVLKSRFETFYRLEDQVDTDNTVFIHLKVNC